MRELLEAWGRWLTAAGVALTDRRVHGDPGQAPLPDVPDELAALHRAWLRLKPAHRLAVWWRYCRGRPMTDREAARLVGVERNTLRSRATYGERLLGELVR